MNGRTALIAVAVALRAMLLAAVATVFGLLLYAAFALTIWRDLWLQNSRLGSLEGNMLPLVLSVMMIALLAPWAERLPLSIMVGRPRETFDAHAFAARLIHAKSVVNASFWFSAACGLGAGVWLPMPVAFRAASFLASVFCSAQTIANSRVGNTERALRNARPSTT